MLGDDRANGNGMPVNTTKELHVKQGRYRIGRTLEDAVICDDDQAAPFFDKLPEARHGSL